MSTRWGKVALSTLVVSAVVLLGMGPGTGRAAAAAPAKGAGPALTLLSQTQWVTPAQPAFLMVLGVGSGEGSAADLHVGVTIYSRIDDPAELEQATSATPDKDVLTRLPPVPVTAEPAGNLAASTCVTVLPDDAASPPAPGTTGSCPAGAPTVVLGCTPGDGTCDDVYPVSVALLRAGDSTPLQRFTTFITYEEPGVATQAGGPLRVGMIVPVADASGAAAATQNTEALVSTLASHHGVATTLDVSPTTVATLDTSAGKGGRLAVRELGALTSPPGIDQLLSPSFVPVNIAALAGVGLSAETALQVSRGSEVLTAASLHPTAGTWVDTTPDSLSNADIANLTTGLQTVHAQQLVVDDTDMGDNESPGGLTYAQPFILPLAHGTHVTAAAADSDADARFTADPSDPVLAANQLVANLAFVHFENEFQSDPRGVVLMPPQGWQASSAFMATLLTGLTNAQVLSPVTLTQLFAQVPIGVNEEPATRHLQSGTAANNGGFTTAIAARIGTYRSQLSSFGSAASGHPPVLTTLSDELLQTERDGLGRGTRSVAVTGYGHTFDDALSSISVAGEGTITFTSRTASIPITVLSTAPYKATVVMTLSSDKFSFPSGSTRILVLTHPTTSVRVEARARTSGDHLPVEVTLRTPEGALVISRTMVIVHSTSISLVGIALTVLAGLVLLIWWARTWRRSRRHRPRAH